MSIFCGYCGSMNSDESLACCSCGKPLSQPVPPKTVSETERETKQTVPETAPEQNTTGNNPPPSGNPANNANTYSNNPNYGEQYNQHQTPPPNYGYQGYGTPNNGNVTFGQAISLCFSNYANFSGRASRSEYWFFFLFNMIISTVVSSISGVFTMISPEAGMVINLVSVVYGIASFIPGIAITIRRLHDTGKSGSYWFLGFIPIVGTILLYVQLARDSEWDNQWGPGNPENAHPPMYGSPYNNTYNNPYYNPYYNPSPNGGYNPYQNNMNGNYYDPYRSNFPSNGYNGNQNNNQGPPVV